VFSGDDHDYCELTHKYRENNQWHNSREVTIKSISMAMGIHHPGFQILSVPSMDSSGDSPAIMDLPCTLPDQVGLYVRTYIPLVICSIAFLALTRFRSSGISTSMKENDGWALQETASYRSHAIGKTEGRVILPTVSEGLRTSSTRDSIVTLLTSCPRFRLIKSRRRERNLSISLLFDILEVACPVFCMFLVVTFMIW